jgi:hypothetical protein
MRVLRHATLSSALGFLLVLAPTCTKPVLDLSTPAGPVSALAMDSIIVRAILDTNGLRSVPVGDVAAIANGRVVALTLVGPRHKVGYLPGLVGGLGRLQELTITDGDLRYLPWEVEGLERLDLLRLERNRLVTLPVSVGSLPALREISLSSNELASLPESFADLRSLQVLRLDHNRLASLPDSLGRFPDLRVLDASNNRLKSVPPSLGLLGRLLTLKLDHNDIEALPEEIRTCTNLRILTARSNRLPALPVGLTDLAGLNVLQVSYNAIASLPPRMEAMAGLMIVDLARNRIVELPAGALGPGSLPHLTSLDVSGNRLCQPPRAVRQWLNGRQPDWQTSQECARADTGVAARAYPVALGDTVDVDGHAVAFLAWQDDGRGNKTFLLSEGGRLALYRSGGVIGLSQLGARVQRFAVDSRGPHIEVRTSAPFMHAPGMPGEYELAGAGASLVTREAGRVRLDGVVKDTAVLGFERGPERRLCRGDTLLVAWGEVRCLVALRWVFADGRAVLPQFSSDTAAYLSAVGITLVARGEVVKAPARSPHEAFSADPEATVFIYDLGGRLLASAPFRQMEELVSSLPNGSYARRIEGGGTAVWERFGVSR